MSSPDEQLDPQALQDDRAAIAEQMKAVSEDGHGRQEQPPPEQEEQPAQEQAEQTPATEDVPSPVAEGEQALDQVEAPPAQEEPTQEELDDYEREIEAIQAPKGASTRTTEVLKILKQKNREEHRAKKELAKQLEQANAREYIDEEKAKEIEELRTFRGTFAATEDLNKKYVPLIQQQDREALGLMMGHGLPQETAKFIADSGGLLRVRDSNARMPAGTTDKDGNLFTGTQAEWYENVLEPIVKESTPKSVQNMINHHLSKAMDALTERNVELARVRQNPQQYFQKQQESQAAFVKEVSERADKQLQKEADFYGEIAKPKEVPKDATAEQKAEVAKHNAIIDDAKESIKRYLQDSTPENMVSMAAARAYRDIATRKMEEMSVELRETKEKLKASEDRWAKAKGIAQTSRQQSTVRPQERREEKPRGFTSDDDSSAISKLLSEVPA